MADSVDIANDHAQDELDRKLACIRHEQTTTSRHFCLDCEEPIPIARQRLGGKVRCLSCQEDLEQRSRTRIGGTAS